jgi:hypothetical protein
MVILSQKQRVLDFAHCSQIAHYSYLTAYCIAKEKDAITGNSSGNVPGKDTGNGFHKSR